jgi:ribosomal protein S18 acetylase RimI-like enzyme
MSHIRPAHHDEKQQVARVWSDSGLGAIADDEWEAISTGPCARIYVAEDEGSIVGAAVTAFDGWRAYIYHVAVTRDHRGEGIAQQLMSEGEKILRARGANRVYLLVNENNTAGIALSASMGYDPEGDVAFVKELAPVLVVARS